MSTHNIYFCGEIRQIFTRYPPLSRPMVWSEPMLFAHISSKPRETPAKDLDMASQKHAYIILTPLNPNFFYSKTGIYRGIHYFSYFCSKT